MSERRQRDIVTARAEADITRLYRPLSRAVGRSVRQHGGRHGATPIWRLLVLNDVEAALDATFGRYAGERGSPLMRVVTQRCREGRAWVFVRHVQIVRSRLRGQTRLLRAIEGDSG